MNPPSALRLVTEEPRPDGARNPRLKQLAALAEELRLWFAPAERGFYSTGLPDLDAALGGGLAGGAVHELIAPRDGVATHTLAWSAAAAAAGMSGISAVSATEAASATEGRRYSAEAASAAEGRRYGVMQNAPVGGGVRPARWIFYIDTLGDLYPPALVGWGVPLDRLIVVRTAQRADALWVMEQVLRCPAVGAALLPLRSVERRSTNRGRWCENRWCENRWYEDRWCENPFSHRRGEGQDRWCENPFSHPGSDAHISRRLQLAAEAGGGLGLLLCREAGGGATFAATRLQFDMQRPAGGRRCLRVTILKQRGGHPQPPLIVEIPDAAHPVSAPAGSVDRTGLARRRASG